jgi:hypothetical protein
LQCTAELNKPFNYSEQSIDVARWEPSELQLVGVWRVGEVLSRSSEMLNRWPSRGRKLLQAAGLRQLDEKLLAA